MQHERPTDWMNDPRNAVRVLRPVVNSVHASRSQKAGVSETIIASSSHSQGSTDVYPLILPSAHHNTNAPLAIWLYPPGPSGADHNCDNPPPSWPLAALPFNVDHAPLLNAANIHQAVDFHAQVPGPYPTNSGTAQYLGRNTSNVQQSFADMSQTPYPVVSAPWPAPDDIDTLLVRKNARGAVRDHSPPGFNPISMGSNKLALRATLPAPFLYFITMDMFTKGNIIPAMINQRLLDLHDTRIFQPRRYFTMPDTLQYAQLSSTSDYTNVVTRQYYSKVPRNPCFPDDPWRPRIYPVEILKRLPKHLERYRSAFPQPLPMVIIRSDEIVATTPEVVRWMHGAIYHVVPTLENRSDCENPDEPEDTLWSMTLKRGISSWNRPYTSAGREVATYPVQHGNMIYEPEELNYFNYAVNVFMEISMLGLTSTEPEPVAMYQGAFILRVMDNLPLGQERWNELSEDRRMEIYDHAPQLFEGLPPFLKSPDIPAVGLYLQNWDMNMLGVLDDLKFEAVAIMSPMETMDVMIHTRTEDHSSGELDQLVDFG
ncbi:hypothetical protein AZE42_08472 [Rhizopogon vesiculosus]|uniref:Uncharacterized protein n=1 Tax=Rhizopogon vesiculosus TaxID=180088 RepID=A0A1J8QTY0_9AGAM|nr:hypothetical protein AZE42_08472 [Rhizopogon vesiculosus]